MAAPGRTHAITATIPALNGGDVNVLVPLNLADPLLSDVFARCLATGLDIAVTAVGSQAEYVKALSNWNYAGQSGTLWFVVPTVAAGGMSQVEVSYGGASTTADQAITTVMGGAVEGFWPLDEAAGNAIDFGPNGYDLAHTNLAAQGVAAEVENGVDYEDGLLSRSENAAAGNFERTQAFTLMCFAKLERIGTAKRYGARFDNGATRGWFVGLQGNEGMFTGLWNNGGNSCYVQSAALAPGIINFHHYAHTYDGSGVIGGISHYYDGGAVGNAATNNTLGANTIITAAAFRCGVQDAGNQSPMDGIVDNLLLVYAELTANQVADNYTLQNNYDGPNTGWAFGAARSLLAMGSKLHTGIRVGI